LPIRWLREDVKMSDFSAVGKSVPRVDALEKVTGVAKFTSEEALALPGVLYGKVLFSPLAHAKIRNIDTSAAERVPGVKAILTGKDVPPHRAGHVIDDRHVLCKERVRFFGDSVAVVAAVSEDAAREAVNLIKVDYEELPAIFDAEEAMKPDCPVVLHPDLANYGRPSMPYLGNDLPGSNVHTHHKVRKGNVEEGFKMADLIIENRFATDRITHCQLEPYNCVAYPESDGGVTVWASVRLRIAQDAITHSFNLPETKVRMRTCYVGGMFGTELRPERFAVLLALKTGRPIRVTYSREEGFLDGLNRIPTVIYVKDGVKSDGTLLAREIRAIVNTGGYSDLAPYVIRFGSFHVNQYRIPNYKWDAYGVYTNETTSGPLRGFGSAECLWATEQQMDIIADKLKLDALEMRRKNTPDEGEEDVRGETIHSIGAKECLDKVAKWIGWGEPCKQPGGSVKRGKGIALGNKMTTSEFASSSVVKVHIDGTIEVKHGTDECGQGCNTVFAQIAAEEFGVPLAKIKVVWGDTFSGPYDFGAAASRSTFFTGNAVHMACKDAKRQIFELAAPIIETTPENLEIANGEIFIKNLPEKRIPLARIFLRFHPEARSGLMDATCLPDGGEIIGKSTFHVPLSEEDPETGQAIQAKQGKRMVASQCYGAQAVEVDVDVETGIVKILRFASAYDVGRALNPKLCEGQMEGGATMGIGAALYEGFVFDESGKLLSTNFHDYRMPSAMEVPSGENMVSMIVEDTHREGPFGAKGMGEATMTCTAPAIANAIYNAVGVRLKQIPMNPERVIGAIKEKS
jgi:carbon-monoxide dehydrogenase large subunit